MHIHALKKLILIALLLSPAEVHAQATATFTPAGTNSAPPFTGAPFDNRPAFMKVIFCSGN